MSVEAKTCEDHGIYFVEDCPGCLYRERFPEAARMYERQLEAWRVAEGWGRPFDDTPSLAQISSRIV